MEMEPHQFRAGHHSEPEELTIPDECYKATG